ncbi:Reverse transcriptase zinc-binding domain protein [Raphanus sativus]|nr:Reverse transcriptase zinc-binding domain protein [Raphanus sativus]
MVLNRCPTRDRILQWGLSTDGNCLLCNAAPESRDHIYYACAFSSEVWITSLAGKTTPLLFTGTCSYRLYRVIEAIDSLGSFFSWLGKERSTHYLVREKQSTPPEHLSFASIDY